jgi:hypothetical protein
MDATSLAPLEAPECEEESEELRLHKLKYNLLYVFIIR